MNHDCAEIIEINEHVRVRIEYALDPLNPREEYDNVATMACWHRRYNLGDVQPSEDPGDFRIRLLEGAGVDTGCPHCAGSGRTDDGDCEACDGYGERPIDELREEWERLFYSLPLYLYDHSGITMSTGSFSCPWDSGQVGFIYVTKERAHQEWGTTLMQQRRDPDTGALLSGLVPVRPMTDEDYLQRLRNEVETYDQYLTGDVYGYVVEVGHTDEEGDFVVDEEGDSCWGIFGIDCARDDARCAGEAAAKRHEAELQERDYWAQRDVATEA